MVALTSTLCRTTAHCSLYNSSLDHICNLHTLHNVFLLSKYKSINRIFIKYYLIWYNHRVTAHLFFVCEYYITNACLVWLRFQVECADFHDRWISFPIQLQWKKTQLYNSTDRVHWAAQFNLRFILYIFTYISTFRSLLPFYKM